MNHSRRLMLPCLTMMTLLTGFQGLNAQTAMMPGAVAGISFPFYIYHGYKSPDNHFIPSGWMGDYGDLKFNDHFTVAGVKKQCIRIAYNAKSTQGAGWAGIYWQNIANNWGDRTGGYNLNGAKRLVFMARGEKGKELIAEFKVGGIGGNFPDSGSISSGPIHLTQSWKRYSIELEGARLSSIAGGFCFALSGSDNPDGAVFYLDDIHYE